MNQIGIRLGEWMTSPQAYALLRGVVILIVGLLLARAAAAAVGRLLRRRGTAQQAMLGRRVTFYGLAGVVVASALNQFGFELGVLLGAAGVLTVAIGFASQTSASNLISGLFLLGERPFVVGDIITAEGTTGEVVAVDLLSVKLRTFDNLFVRIPNETIIKSPITNLTRYPIRRIDTTIRVGYDDDVLRVQEKLIEVADANPLCLDEPQPLLIYLGFGESGLQIQFSVWTTRENFLETRNQIQRQITETFSEAGIEIPLPQRVLSTRHSREPLPVRIVEDRQATDSSTASEPYTSESPR